MGVAGAGVAGAACAPAGGVNGAAPPPISAAAPVSPTVLGRLDGDTGAGSGDRYLAPATAPDGNPHIIAEEVAPETPAAPAFVSFCINVVGSCIPYASFT